MAYTFLDLKNKLATQISDSNLDTTVTGDALNYTQQEIFGKFDLTLNSAQQTNSVIAGTNTLASALPTDYERMSSLYVTSPATVVTDLTDYFVATKEFRKRFTSPSTSGRAPLSYWTYWTSLEFSNNADQDYTLVLDYIKSIPFMSADSDVPTIPQAYEEMLMLGAKIRIFEQKEDFDYANQFVNRYADLIESFIIRYSTRQVDNQVVIPGSRGRV